MAKSEKISLDEAPLVKSFGANPEPDDTEGLETPDEEYDGLPLFKGWLPVEDEMSDVVSSSSRVKLEAFIREVLSVE